MSLFAAFVLDSCLRASSSRGTGLGSNDNTDKDSSAGSDETDRDSITFVLGSNSNITPGADSRFDANTSSKVALINNYLKSNGTYNSANNNYCEQPMPPPAPILPRSKKMFSGTGSVASLPVGTTQSLMGGNSRTGPFVPPRRIMSQQRYL